MIGWLLQAMAGTTLVMILVLTLRRPVAHLFGAEWAYALWILPPLRLVLPPISWPQSPLSAALLPPADAEVLSADLAALALDWPGVLAALWLGGAALYLSWQQSSYGAFLLHLGPEGRSGEPPDFGGIKVIESEAVDGPMAVGIWRRRIVVPPDFATRYSPAEQQLALEHELVHHRRFDIMWNLVALLFLALNWFNPVAHFAFRAFRADQELACDAVVAKRRPHARGDYARALVKSASQSGLLTAAPLNHAEFLKRRLKMMPRHRCSRLRTLGGSAALAVAAAAGLLLSSPGQARPEIEPGMAPRQELRLAAADIRPSLAVQPEAKAGVRQLARCGKAASPRAARPVKTIQDPVEPRPVEADHMKVAAAPESPGDVEAVLHEANATLAAAVLRRAQAEEMAERVRREVVAEASARAAVVRKAVERARARLAHVDVRAVELAALDSAAAAMERRAIRVRLTRSQWVEIREAIADKRREIERTDFSAELRDLQAEADRDIAKELERTVPEMPAN